MKKITALFMAAAIGMSLTACNEKNNYEEEKPEQGVEAEAEPVDEFYEAMTESDSRPIAVMIDNDADYTGPQAGLENAYLIYEAYVEGGGTRMMALYNEALLSDEEKAEKIGPVRSARHYFLDFALENDAVYAHCGFSPKAQSEISSRNVNNINGLYESTPFERYTQYNNTWHNLYTSYDKLYTAAEKHDYRMTSDVKPDYAERKAPLDGGTDATEISIPYSVYTMSYTYDAENGVYMRCKKGQPHTMQSGVRLSFENVIILRMQNYDLNDGTDKGRQELSDTGTGKGTYITEGKSIPITWKRENRASKTEYYSENGEKLLINPGKTFIQIVPESMNVTIS